MNKIASFFLFLLVVTVSGFSENLVLENQTSYPNKDQKSKIAVQWAHSGNEVDEGNKAITNDTKINSERVQLLTQSGKISLSIPKDAEYFRVLVWSKEGSNPDLLTNWVDIVPGKTYTLKADHLVPSVLMLGT